MIHFGLCKDFWQLILILNMCKFIHHKSSLLHINYQVHDTFLKPTLEIQMKIKHG
jgi:hypothetical protein